MVSYTGSNGSYQTTDTLLYPVFEDIVGQAIIDREFRAGLLHGKRKQVLRPFKLSSEEQQVLMDIRADTLEGFAQQLHTWIKMQPPPRRQLRPD